MILSTWTKRVLITIILWLWTFGAWAGDVPVLKLILLYLAFIMTLITLLSIGERDESE